MQSPTTSGFHPRDMMGQWRCEFCDCDFHRYDHYKRHLDTHNSMRSYRCEFCGSQYKRGDVLRRHWQSCSARRETGEGIPEARSGGKQRHACDSCAKLKRHCNGQQPCAECLSRDRSCTYIRLSGKGDPAADDGHLQGGNFYLDSEVNFDLTAHSKWDLGQQTFYPDRHILYQAYKRIR